MYFYFIRKLDSGWFGEFDYFVASVHIGLKKNACSAYTMLTSHTYYTEAEFTSFSTVDVYSY